MQTVIVTGRLGRDAKIYTSSNGNRFITFSIASNTRVKKNEENTYWWDVVVPSHSVERYKNMVEYLTKGSSVIVQGELDPDIYYDNNNKAHLRLTISAVSIQFNSLSKQDTNGQSNTNFENSPVGQPASHQQASNNNVTEESITIQTSKTKPTSKSKPTLENDVSADEELPF